VFWTRVDVINQREDIGEWLLELQYPMLDSIQIFVAYADGRIETAASGDTLPFASRAVKHRFPMFKVSLPRGQVVSIYLRAHSSGAVQLPLRLQSPADLLARDHDEQFVLGIYYGILIAMFLYNTMLYLSVRDRNYLYYVVYIFSWTVMQLCINGLAFEYLWPESPQWANTAILVILGLVICSTAQFASSFLELQRRMPMLAKVFKAFLVLGAVLMLASALFDYGTLIKLGQVLALAECIAAFAAGCACLRHGGRQSRYFMLAWTMLLVGAMLYLLQNSGYIATIFLTEYGLQIGSAVEVLLFSFALAHRMKQLQDENVRIQREATDNLEKRVQQRTLELDGALANLSDAHQRLKDLSRIDGLTGIKNRTYFNEKASIEWQRGMREKQALGVLMIDIDHFKRINDSFGHLGGDLCLKEVAHTLAHKIHRIADDAFRFGGEEFVVMLPHTDLAGAMHMGEVMRKGVEGLDIIINNTRVPLTISVGVACLTPKPGEALELLIGQADQALYQAKNAGRNRVCSADAAGTVPA
jgi:diguanylate cyclase (GGDEF)-like protein